MPTRSQKKYVREAFFNNNKDKDGVVKCYYCQRAVIIGGGNNMDTATIDHFIPRSIAKSLGIPDNEDNWKVACRQCNQENKNKLHADIMNLYNSSRSSAKSKDKLIKKLGKNFVEIISIGFHVYNTSQRRLYCRYEG